MFSKRQNLFSKPSRAGTATSEASKITMTFRRRQRIMLNSLRASLAIRLQWFQTAPKEKQLSTEHNHTLYINPESIALGIFCYKRSEFVFVPFTACELCSPDCKTTNRRQNVFTSAFSTYFKHFCTQKGRYCLPLIFRY